MLARREGAEVVLKNNSYPGARTDDVIRDLLSDAISGQPDMVMLLIGTNDIHGRVGLEKFRENYKTILERLSRETKARIYVISIPFIGSDTLYLPPYGTYFESMTIEYNRAVKELTEAYGAKYIDIAGPTKGLFQKDGEHYSADLFHPSSKGYGVWADLIYGDLD